MKVLLTLMFAVALTLPAAAVKADNIQLAQQLLDESGFTKEVNDLPSLLKESITQLGESQPDIPKQAINALLKAVETTYQPQTISEQVVNALSENMTTDDFERLLEWYGSETGKFIVDVEARSELPVEPAELDKASKTLAEDEALMAYSQKVNEIIGLTDYALQFQVSSQLAMMASFNQIAAPGSEFDLEGARAQMQAHTQMLKPMLSNMVTLDLANAYRELNDEQRVAYQAFLQTEESQAYSQHAIKSLIEVFESSISTMAANTLKFL